MSDFPKGGDIEATRAWLDKKRFEGIFVGWKADAILGADKAYILKKAGENGLMLWGLLNTARISTADQDISDFSFPCSANEFFPDNGIGSFIIYRNVLVNKMIDIVSRSKVSNYYFRGPRGSGKSFVLNLLGKKLREMNHKVFLIEHAGKLRVLSEKKLMDIDASLTDRAFILIDEVHENPSDAMWNFLLKKTHKHLVVIGVGIPTLDGGSPAFKHKFPANFFHFKNEDFDVSVFEKFEELFRFGLAPTDLCTRSVVEYTLNWVLSYTGGHAFPFLKLSENLLEHKKQNCIDQNLDSIICGAEFFESQNCKDVTTRSYQFSSEVIKASIKIFTSGIIEKSNELTLSNAGLWNDDEKWFLSKFLVFHLFSIQEKKEYSDKSLDIQEVIEIGLNNLADDNFSQCINGFTVNRYENSIGSFIGWNIASIKSILVSPQHIVPKLNPSFKGASPSVDFYVNGSIDCYIEIVRDSLLLEDQFKRFDKGGKYELRQGKNFVVLDIKLTSSEPAKVADKYKNRLYTFVKSRNALFLGDKLVKSRVSKFLPSMHHREFFTSSSSYRPSSSVLFYKSSAIRRFMRYVF